MQGALGVARTPIRKVGDRAQQPDFLAEGGIVEMERFTAGSGSCYEQVHGFRLGGVALGQVAN